MEGLGAETLFDDAVRIAASACAAPIALLSFVERDGMEVRASVGTYPSRPPREFGFCARTIAARRFVTLPDATRDPEAAQNPALGFPLFARFYAGAPLLGFDGNALGTLAIYDHVPRRLEPWQEETLVRVARLLAGSLEIEASQRARERRRGAALAALAGGLAAELKGRGGSPRAADLARQLLALAGHRSLRPSSIDLNHLLDRLFHGRSEEEAGAWSLLLDPAIGTVLGDEERIGRAISGLARRAATPFRPVPIATREVRLAPGSPACGTLAPGAYVLVSIGRELPSDFEALLGNDGDRGAEPGLPASGGIDDVEGLMAETGGRVVMLGDPAGPPVFCLALPRAAD
ncbi:MAG TPA: GAF domain-containing protein [Verrucomicrobiae bacterium]|nr:GAF domain-containing protein [Verrucomicrobiae bacterium]